MITDTLTSEKGDVAIHSPFSVMICNAIVLMVVSQVNFLIHE